MSQTNVTKARVEVDPDNPNLIWVRGVTIDPDKSASAAMSGLPRNDFYVANLTSEMWGGDKDERAELIEAGIGNETLVDIPIWFTGYDFYTDKARKIIKDLGIGYGLPCCLDSLKDAKIRKALRNLGVWWVAALGQSNEKLFQLEGDSRLVYLRLNPARLGFRLARTDTIWGDDHAAVGFPRKHQG